MGERLVFTRSLYLPEAVDAAAKAFAAFAEIEVNVLDDEVELSLKNADPDVADVLADELANYVLAETIRRVRG